MFQRLKSYYLVAMLNLGCKDFWGGDREEVGYRDDSVSWNKLLWLSLALHWKGEAHFLRQRVT